MACWLIISSTPSSQPDSPLPMSGIDRWILSAEAFCLRKKFPRCISSALRTGVLLPPEDGFRQMIGSFGVVPLRRPHLRATVLIGQRSPRVAQPILYEDCAVCGVNRVELLTVGADRRLVIVALLGRHLLWYEHLNVPSTIGTAIPKWEQHDARSLAVRAGARLVFQPPTPYVPPFSVMIHHKSHVTDVQIRRATSLAFRGTGPPSWDGWRFLWRLRGCLSAALACWCSIEPAHAACRRAGCGFLPWPIAVSHSPIFVLATYLSCAARKPQHLCAIRQYYLIVSRRRQGEWQRDIATAQSPRGLCIVSPGTP